MNLYFGALKDSSLLVKQHNRAAISGRARIARVDGFRWTRRGREIYKHNSVRSGGLTLRPYTTAQINTSCMAFEVSKFQFSALVRILDSRDGPLLTGKILPQT